MDIRHEWLTITAMPAMPREWAGTAQQAAVAEGGWRRSHRDRKPAIVHLVLLRITPLTLQRKAKCRCWSVGATGRALCSQNRLAGRWRQRSKRRSSPNGGYGCSYRFAGGSAQNPVVGGKTGRSGLCRPEACAANSYQSR